MADHDRDAGSRGEEEAPRDPTPSSEPTQELHEPAPLKYGEQADRAYTYIPPTQPDPASWEREPSPFGDFLRRRRTQVMGAGMAGLLVGGLLGGVTVAALNDVAHDRHEMWMEAPGWGHHRGWEPRLQGPGCYAGEDHGYCVLPPPAEVLPDEPAEQLEPEPAYRG
ncbi:hypothetical protein HD597_008322 [Nonomuraea thailandensis]|uniref:Uncharacterized protein n=1 Tax=Nonomuraea thailandensis TaxID=1188745 RepID=A0A9X2GP24_9ACTN|nr:hypothetical protein [Nonomuraea thailandensis]MCP2361302.1 hypothetical protein [Nonomuraea thailandensis]